MRRHCIADYVLLLQARAAVLTAAQCATYNEAKTAWMNMTNGGDTLSTHVGASMISGLVTTTLTAPVDVIKTNMFVGMLLYCCNHLHLNQLPANYSCKLVPLSFDQ